MIRFVKATWRRFRPESGTERKLRWPWAALAVAVAAVLYGIIAPVCWAVGWLCRRDFCPVWLRRFGGSAGDWTGGIFLSGPTTGRPSGAGGVVVRPDDDDLEMLREMEEMERQEAEWEAQQEAEWARRQELEAAQMAQQSRQGAVQQPAYGYRNDWQETPQPHRHHPHHHQNHHEQHRRGRRRSRGWGWRNERNADGRGRGENRGRRFHQTGPYRFSFEMA